MNVIDPKIETMAEAGTEQDTWVPTSCALCYGSCSILAHRVDGTIIKLEGNPASAVGKGRMCGKGVSGLMTHYDPHRLTHPLRRTNLEKGIGVDPGWKQISWEEALAEITENLVRIRADDPRKSCSSGPPRCRPRAYLSNHSPPVTARTTIPPPAAACIAATARI